MSDDPARVLADIAAKRAIVAMATKDLADVDSHAHAGDLIADSFIAGAAHAARNTLLALAQPYAEHPGFDPAWRVS